MNLLILLIPIWVFFPVPGSAISDPPLSSVSDPVLPTESLPFSQIPSEIEAHSPGDAGVKVVGHHQDLNKKILIALIVASSLLGGILVLLSCVWIYKQKSLKLNKFNIENQQSFDASEGLSSNPVKSKFSSMRKSGKKGVVAVLEYPLLVDATNNFREENILGGGGFGCVYKARFNDNFIAAVKRIHTRGQDTEREFENELDWLSKTQHQNVISLLGFCIHGDMRFLVYEMMDNGSLEFQLHGPSHGLALTWHLRMKIALDIARGLEYLHERCNPPLIHRDLKSSNILLDSNFNAKLSDFGLAVSSGGIQNKNIKLSGTLGYVAPEYLLDGKLTDKSDVYAFGVVLLELLMGKRPVEKLSPSQCQSIVTWAMPQLTDRSKLPTIVDPVIRDTMDLKHLYQVAAVAVLCVQPEPSYRPLITDVLHSFIPLVPSELGGSLRFADTRH